ncbi:MAG: VOC family protein [Bryobacteraceae bacterium]|nr:VOC family protein [Bryobacteraceae bacterium]
MAHPVTQFQILSKDPDATARFCEALFGWRIDAGNPMGYRRIDTGSSEGIQGGIWPAPPQASAFVQLFIAVEDAAQKSAEAQELGAKLLIPPTRLPEGDEMAVLLDPQGMPFVLWRRAGSAAATSR